MSIKKIGNYRIDVNSCAKGSHATFHLASKVDNPDSKQFIAKCLNFYEANQLTSNLKYERENSKMYSNCNATTIYKEFLKSPNHIYLIYIYYPSLTLERFLKSASPNDINIKFKIEIILWILKALKDLHEEGKSMHRNLTPSHILINIDKKEIKFCGNTTIFYFGNNYPSDIVGENPYKAPEIGLVKSKDDHYNEKADIYSLGIIVFQIFAKSLGFESGFIMNPKYIEDMETNIPELKDFILQCINNDPILRPTANDLLHSKLLDLINSNNNSMNNYQFHSESALEKNKSISIRIVDSLDPYIITGEVLGKGGFAEVVKGINTKTNMNVAIKFIYLDKLISQKEKDLVIGEIDLLNKMKQHSFIVGMEDNFYYNGKLGIVLEYCNGGDAKKYVDSLKRVGKGLKMDEVKLIAWNVAEGINYLHKNQIVHRDIKPQNILLIKDSKNIIIDAKICDLGLSKKLEIGSDEYLSICGTIEYMAPEVRNKANSIKVQLTSKTDTFSFGLLLNFLAFGETPIILQKEGGQRVPGIYYKIPPYAKIYKNLYELIQKCLEEDPNKRISIEQIINDEFFQKVNIGICPKKISVEKLEQNYEGKWSYGFANKDKQEWIKIFKVDAGDQCLKYIEREIDFLQKMKSCPHIVQLISFGKEAESGKIFEIFEYCNGDSLDSLFIIRTNSNAQKRFSVKEIKVVSKCVLDFLDALHSKNYVHRSLNPSHILTILDHFTHEIKGIKICGFTTAKFVDNAITSFVCEEDEQSFIDPTAFEIGYSEESDLWSLGMIIYFMVFEQKFINNTQEWVSLKSKFNMSYPYNIDPIIDSLIKFCTKSKKPNEFSGFSISRFLTEIKLN